MMGWRKSGGGDPPTVEFRNALNSFVSRAWSPVEVSSSACAIEPEESIQSRNKRSVASLDECLHAGRALSSNLVEACAEYSAKRSASGGMFGWTCPPLPLLFPILQGDQGKSLISDRKRD